MTSVDECLSTLETNDKHSFIRREYVDQIDYSVHSQFIRSRDDLVLCK